MAFRRPVEKGYLVNWEAEKEIWDRMFLDEGSVVHVRNIFFKYTLRSDFSIIIF
jgi:actin-related protein